MAGSIASRDAVFPGVAPGVELIDVKVLRSNGTGRHTFVLRGIDEALDRGADILSMSLGLNHLPTWSPNGHGWSCPDGRCALCAAVDNAVTLDGQVVVAAAGNEHERAQALLVGGEGNAYDTELGCPGQAREAITVAAHRKGTFPPAPFSSCGPTSYGLAKPDLCAPGVNITSTIRVPRDSAGRPVSGTPRHLLFSQMGGPTNVVGGGRVALQRL